MWTANTAPCSRNSAEQTPYRDGTTHVVFEPLDFIAKLAALLPKPCVNLTRFHPVFVPNNNFRVRVTRAKRGRGRKRRQPTGENWLDKPPAERHAAMTWMQWLKRVFTIDTETCERCAEQVKISPCEKTNLVSSNCQWCVVFRHFKCAGVPTGEFRKPVKYIPA